MQSISCLFERQVKKYPDHIAIDSEDSQLTYRELNRIANGVAKVILQARSGPVGNSNPCFST